ncbi:Protein phosphatase 2C [Entamoeba marina]
MGTLLSTPVTEQHSEQIDGSILKCGATSMQGWRRTMEDAHTIKVDAQTIDGKKVQFFGVFDGHGGDQVALYCEEVYFDILVNTESFKKGDYKQSLIDVNIKIDEVLKTEEVNNKLKSLGSGNNIYEGMFGDTIANGMGCTCVVVLIVDNILYCGNAGDSRGVLLKNNNVIALSEDHKPTLQSEIDRITAAGGTIDNGRVNGNLNLTRTIGDLMYKQQPELRPEGQIISCYPDITKYELDGNEKLLVLACDGIWDVLTNEQIIEKINEYLRVGNSLQETCEKITSDCLSKQPYTTPGWDNMTLIIIQFNSYKVEPIEQQSSQSTQELHE